MTAQRVAFEIKINVHIFAKTTRIIVSIGLCVSKRFQNAIRLKQNILYSNLCIEVITKSNVILNYLSIYMN